MSCFIRINDKLAVTSDKRQWMISERKPRKDKTGELIDTWEPKSFYHDLGLLLKALHLRLVREGDARTWEELESLSTRTTLALRKHFPTISIEVKQ